MGKSSPLEAKLKLYYKKANESCNKSSTHSCGRPQLLSYTNVTELNFMSKRCAPNNHPVPLKNNRAVDKEITFKKISKNNNIPLDEHMFDMV